MNIKELAEQAGVIFDTDPTYTYGASPKVLKRFAELVAAAEREACAEHYLGIMRDAVEQAVLREREACAKVCETVDAAHEGDYVLAKWCAAAIRARGDKHD